MEIKIGCLCGQKYKFDVEPREGRMPFTVACPVCGADGTEGANQYLAQQFPSAAAPVRVAAVAAAPPAVDGTAESSLGILEGTWYCNNHPKHPARFLCPTCNHGFCDMCTSFSEVGGRPARTCLDCAVELAPVQFRPPPPKGYYSKLPGAFLYPFKGAGIIIIVCAAIGFSAVNFLGFFAILLRIALYGFIFLFMQNIILTTTTNEKEQLAFPDASGLFGAAFQLAGTVVASFWPAIGLEIAKINGVAVPSEAIIATVILGGIYFPMALLVVAMKDTVVAANPLIVIPAMAKAPMKYAVTAALTLAVFGVRQLGNLVSGGAGTVSLRTHDTGVFFVAAAFQAIWALLSVYLLTVTMRILGLFYNATKKELGWFNS